MATIAIYLQYIPVAREFSKTVSALETLQVTKYEIAKSRVAVADTMVEVHSMETDVIRNCGLLGDRFVLILQGNVGIVVFYHYV